MTAQSSKSLFSRILSSLLTLLLAGNIFLAQSAAAESQRGRKIKSNPPPEYPELARKMNIQGIARVLITVTPEGTVTTVKELGGNPVLVAALVRAVKGWKYEPADRESEIEIKYDFVQ